MPAPIPPDSIPDTQLPPPPTGRHEWLRWPIAWGLAAIASMGLLTCLGVVIPSGIRLVPQRLLAALQIPVPTAKPAPALRPPTRNASVEASAQPSRQQHLLLPEQAAPQNREAPLQPQPEPGLTARNPGPDAPARPGPDSTKDGNTPAPSADSMTGSPGGTYPGTADLASLPPAQRCEHRPAPTFPLRAREDGVEHGHVMVRLRLDAQGTVRTVTILEASPAGYFETETRRAALQWHCLTSGREGDSVRVPFEFNLQ